MLAVLFIIIIFFGWRNSTVEWEVETDAGLLHCIYLDTVVCVDLAKLERAKPNHKINYCCLQNVNQKAVHMNVIMWLGFLFSL